MNKQQQQRLDDHEKLYQLYRATDQFCDVLAALESPKAEFLRELLRSISQGHVLDRVLKVKD